MPHYHRLGKIPAKRHTQFRKEDGMLFSEHLISREGFSDVYSLAYRHHPPTRVSSIDEAINVTPEIALEENMQHRSFQGFNIKPAEDYILSRIPVLVNDDVYIVLAAPQSSTGEYFFRNSSADEMIFIHRGEGNLKTMYGVLPFKYGDHLVIPKGTTYQLQFKTRENRLFILESFSPFRFPGRYVNRNGQLMEHAPFYERDIQKPLILDTYEEKGDYLVYVKKENKIYPYHYTSHPFDVIGWDGYLYPYSFSIHNFEPITGRIHQPPPVHQTFETDTFVVCAFVPRLYDYHPLAIPAPYNHTNIDSDEVLYYVDGDFMSRKHVEQGQITLHPIGIPHGPHPGTVEKSIGAKETRELALMVDTFKPLKLTKQALEIEDDHYFESWMD